MSDATTADAGPGQEFQELTLDDIEELVAESSHAFLPSAKHPEETAETLFAKFKNDPIFKIYGHCIEGRPVSYIVALSHEDETIAIGPMYVAEQFRGRGIGTRQVHDFIAVYRARGFHSFYTKTWAGNVASRSTFEKLGFVLLGRTEHDRMDGDATLAFSLSV